MTIPEKPEARTDVVLRELGPEAMLYDPVADRVVRLNDTSRAVWALCDGSRDAGEIAAAIREEFAVPETADLVQDVRETLAALQAAGVFADERLPR